MVKVKIFNNFVYMSGNVQCSVILPDVESVKKHGQVKYISQDMP